MAIHGHLWPSMALDQLSFQWAKPIWGRSSHLTYQKVPWILPCHGAKARQGWQVAVAQRLHTSWPPWLAEGGHDAHEIRRTPRYFIWFHVLKSFSTLKPIDFDAFCGCPNAAQHRSSTTTFIFSKVSSNSFKKNRSWQRGPHLKDLKEHHLTH